MKHQVKLCDSCRCEMDIYEGVDLLVKELMVTGDKRRVFPGELSKQVDLCNECYAEVADALRSVLTQKVSCGL